MNKEKIIEINKQFSDGTIRDEGTLDYLLTKKGIETVKGIARLHPFFDGNKRTAIKVFELFYSEENVPDFVYEILGEV